MSQKYYTTVSRYVNGKYVVASPDYPALVKFPDDAKINKDDRSLTPAEEGEPATPKEQGVVSHFAKIDRGPGKMEKDRKGARPSDVDPA